MSSFITCVQITTCIRYVIYELPQREHRFRGRSRAHAASYRVSHLLGLGCDDISTITPKKCHSFIGVLRAPRTCYWPACTFPEMPECSNRLFPSGFVNSADEYERLQRVFETSISYEIFSSIHYITVCSHGEYSEPVTEK